MTEFIELDLPPALLQSVAALGYAMTTPVQSAALPPMLAGQDVLAQARTGSGKTAAFGLALLAGLDPERARVQALVLCPTRELADQVAKEIRALARFMPNVKVSSLCGGVPVRAQLASLVHEPHIAVGTPGRIRELIDRKALPLDEVASLVLDEADRMLDMGFLDVIQSILAGLPEMRKTWLFSATYPTEIRTLSARFQRSPATVTVADAPEESVIRQLFYRVEHAARAEAVIALLLERQPQSCLVFCNMKIDVRDLTETLCQRGIAAIALHGDLEQRDRDETLLQFANGSRRVLVATDVAARGLDIKSLSLVISAELPGEPEVHVHRIGRTGRAGEAGLALTLVADRDVPRLLPIEAAMTGPVEWADLPPRAGLQALPPAAMQTLAIDGGKQDKLRPGDILGALTGDAGILSADIGKIDLFPTRAYVAVRHERAQAALSGLRRGKIKGRTFRIRIL